MRLIAWAYLLVRNRTWLLAGWKLGAFRHRQAVAFAHRKPLAIWHVRPAPVPPKPEKLGHPETRGGLGWLTR
jgi:hypothetical protein